MMNGISRDTRLEAYLNRPVTPRSQEILEALGNDEMTARQIAARLGYNDMNAVRPRLTELAGAGAIEVSGKAYDSVTKRHTGVYRRVTDDK